MSVHSSKVRNAMNHKPAGSRPVSASPSAPTPRPALASRLATLVRGHRAGLFALAFAVGIGSGLGAVAFRYLVYGITWLMTGQTQFGQAGTRPARTPPSWESGSSSSPRCSEASSTDRSSSASLPRLAGTACRR